MIYKNFVDYMQKSWYILQAEKKSTTKIWHSANHFPIVNDEKFFDDKMSYVLWVGQEITT